MNILYYGANNTINDKVIDKSLNNQLRTHKNIKYFENNQYLSFPTLNISILIFIKSIIQTTTINNVIRKIILFNIEQLDNECMTFLRIILEKYSNTTIFIATTIQRSKIDKPILSRFISVRVPIEENIIENTPVKNINIKPTLTQIKKLVKKSKKYAIRDIALHLLEITPYKKQFIEQASTIEHQYCFHNNKELAIEALILVCFYPPKYDIKSSK
jgi:DNA polymerase III delta prime subunit